MTGEAEVAALVGRGVARADDGTGTAIAALRWLPGTELVVVHGGTATAGARAEITRLLDGARRLGVADRVRDVDRHSLIAERLSGSGDVLERSRTGAGGTREMLLAAAPDPVLKAPADRS
ncbi:hypothetical protein ACFV4N_32720 [Actinosynnema sp. NPDC059797]